MSDRPDNRPKRYVSKSQLETYGKCPRKWGFDKLNGIRFPKPAAELGQDAHDVLEAYVKFGTHPEDYPAFPEGKHRIDPREVALRGLHLAPEPLTGECEAEVNFTDAAGITFYGFADWHEYVGCDVGDFADWREYVGKKDDRRLDLLDYKTTSNLKYAHTPDTLWSDVQATIYARYFMEKYGMDTVWLTWLYISTAKDRKTARKVEVELTYADVLRGWQPITDAALEVYRARATYNDAHQLPQNLGHCMAYNGCEYQDLCLTSSQKLALAFEPQVDDTVPLSRLVEVSRDKNKGKSAMDMMQLLQQQAEQNDRSVGEPAPQPVVPPSLAEVATSGADPQNIPSGTPVKPGMDPAKVLAAFDVQETADTTPSPAPTAPATSVEPFPESAEPIDKKEAAAEAPGTLRINAPETAGDDGFDASKAQEQIDKLKADVKKAKVAGAKASKEALAQVLAASVHGKGVEEGIKACDWWLERFGEDK